MLNPGKETMKKLIVGLLAVNLLVGCATASKDIASTYVSPLQYQTYSCEQMKAESSRIGMRLSEISGSLDSAASNDKVLVGVSLILFWPAALALGGNKAQEAEYARLKGEYDTLGKEMIVRKCPGVVNAN
jgi:hypothetical protein